MKSTPKTDCLNAMHPVREALEVLNGKWKLLILISVAAGNSRFGEIARSIPGISAKILAKELRELQHHQLIRRTVYDDAPVVIEYAVTEYANTLKGVVLSLRNWGSLNRLLNNADQTEDTMPAHTQCAG